MTRLTPTALRLGSFFENITPKLISHLRIIYGTDIFNKHILEETGDSALAFTGLNSCRTASKFLAEELEKAGEHSFRIVSDSSGSKHHFLHDKANGDSIVDSSWKQLFSYTAMDAIFSRMLQSKDDEVRRAAFTHLRIGHDLIRKDAALDLQKSISADHEIIFYGSSKTLKTTIENLHDRKCHAYNFSSTLSSAMLDEVLSFWDGDPKKWVEVSPIKEKPLPITNDTTASLINSSCERVAFKT